MKNSKHFTRLLAAALMLVMVVSLTPLSAYAADLTTIFEVAFSDQDAKLKPYETFPEVFIDGYEKDFSKGGVIKASDFDKYIRSPYERDAYYELAGIGGWEDIIANGNEELNIPAFPEKGTMEQQNDWYNKYGTILVSYVPHNHSLANAPWRFDNNFHWKNCSECGRRVFLTWHSDHDEDGICDLCGNAIKYYNITVKDAPGGKVTLSAEKGEMNDRINVTVTPDAGYHLQSIKFFNNNAKHSQLTRWEDKAGSEYHFVILNWDIEVEATFVKD